MPVPPSTHTWFWFLAALFIVGAFLAVGGILRRTLDVTDRAYRLLTVTGLVIAICGLGGALAVAATAPGSTVAVVKDMLGLGGTETAPPPPPKPGAKTVDVTGVDFKFEPSSITAAAGSTIEFTNGGQSPHTFNVEGTSFELTADPGGSDRGSLKGFKPGTYQVICSIPGHAQLGMKATLVVQK